MNFGQIYNEVLAHEMSPITYGARVKLWVNQAYHHACRDSEIPQLEAVQTYQTVSGTKTIALPAGYARIRNLTLTDQALQLQPVPLTDVDTYTPNVNSSPSIYALSGSNLLLYPTPDAVYNLQLRYWQDPPDLINDLDIPVIPSAYHHLLIWWALMEAYRAEDDFQGSQFYEGKYTRGLAEMRTDLQHPNQDFPVQVGGTWADRHGRPGSRSWYGGGF